MKVSRLKIGSKFILQNKDRILENLFLESKQKGNKLIRLNNVKTIEKNSTTFAQRIISGFNVHPAYSTLTCTLQLLDDEYGLCANQLAA